MSTHTLLSACPDALVHDTNAPRQLQLWRSTESHSLPPTFHVELARLNNILVDYEFFLAFIKH